MRRTPPVLLVCWALLALLALLVGCSDDDDDGSGPSTTAVTVSTEGTCGVVDAAHASEVMDVSFDEALPGDGSCTFTSSTSSTAFTIQVSDQGANDPALVLQTLGGSCDPDTREDRTFEGADGGFSCLAGGVPNVVATGQGVVLVLTGNSREEGVTPEMVAEDLAAIVQDALRSLDES